MSGLALAMVVSVITGAAGADALLMDGEGRPGGGLEPLHFTRTEQNPAEIEFKFLTEDKATVWLRLTRRDDGRAADLRLERYNVDIEVEPASVRAALQPAIDKAIDRLKERQIHGPDLRRPRVDQPYEPLPGATKTDEREASGAFRKAPEAQRLASVELRICLVLLLFTLGGLVWLFTSIAPSLGWGMSGPRDVSLHRWTLGAFVVVVATQVFCVPQLLVTVFSGYASVAEALALSPVAKYGAATTALYGPLLQLLGPDTGVITGTNVAIGLLTVLLAAAWIVRLSDRPFLAPLAVLVIGLLPALMRDRASESVLVPMALWVLAAWLHGDLWYRSGRLLHGLLALANLALALNARPEVWVVAPVLVASVLSLEGRWGQVRAQARAHGAAAVALVCLCAPRAWSLWHYVGDAATHGDVPGLGQGGDLAGIVNRFLTHNALWLPEIHPVTATALALVAPALVPRGRRLAVGLVLGSALLWQGLSTVDLPPVSIPRVQAPAMLWTASLAVVAVGWLFSGERSWSRPLAALLYLLVLVPSPGTVSSLWQPTNAQSFDQWWERAIDSVPQTDKPRCVVALAMSDPPRDIVLRHYPLYELEERSSSVEIYGLETFLEAPGQVLDGHCEPLYLQGPQCAARFFGFGAEPPAQAELLPLCAHIHRGFHLAPIYVEDMENQGNADFPFYGRSETLRYGLYRIDRQAMLPP